MASKLRIFLFFYFFGRFLTDCILAKAYLNKFPPIIEPGHVLSLSPWNCRPPSQSVCLIADWIWNCLPQTILKPSVFNFLDQRFWQGELHNNHTVGVTEGWYGQEMRKKNYLFWYQPIHPMSILPKIIKFNMRAEIVAHHVHLTKPPWERSPTLAPSLPVLYL